MPVITPSTFDALNGYKSVVYGQQVPLVDADINEESDIRRFETQSALKWILGDGTPEGHDDAFRIVATGLANDFEVLSGTPPAADALENVGRCFVNGLQVLILIPNGFMFSDQPLHDSQPGSAALAAALGVPQISLAVPVANGVWTIFVDVWHRLLTATEEPSLIHPALGVESSARWREEFAIRVREGTEAPQQGDADYIADHHYLALAHIERRSGDPLVNADDVTDLRRRQLRVQSSLDIQQLMADSFGPGYVLDTTGNTRLPFSLREVINAILGDGRPAVIGPRLLDSTSPPYLFPASTFAADGTQWVGWVVPGAAPGTFELMVQHVDAAGPVAPASQFVLPGTAQSGVAMASQPDGSVWAIYSVLDGNFQVRARRHFSGVWEPEITLAAADENHTPVAATSPAGEILVVWVRRIGANVSLHSRIIQLGGALTPEVLAAPDSEPEPAVFGIALAALPSGDFRLYAIHDPGGPPNWPIRVKQFSGGAWDPAYVALTDAPVDVFVGLAAARDPAGGDWLFWVSAEAGVGVLRARRVLGTDVFAVRQLDAAPTLSGALAVTDPDGNLQVIYPSATELNRQFLIFEI